MFKVGLVSLGCPRNLTDSETMLGLLKAGGFDITEDVSGCDAAIVNTCSFIKDAKEESVDLILKLLELKKEKKIRSVIVAGCLPQRYSSELREEMAEVDAFVGTSDFSGISDIVRKTLDGAKITAVSEKLDFLADHTYRRDLIPPGHYMYLKVAEGCDNNCSYCVIPKIRGRLRSRSIDSLLQEALELSRRYDISEINLIGQDITLYGADLYGSPRLTELLKKLTRLKIAGWHRLLYTHPEHYTDGLLDIVKGEPSVCKYLDLPLQHISDRILKLMNRKTTRGSITKLIERIRKRVPGAAIRTTFIVGFPGETDDDFKELLGFISQIKFERLGVFEYSREEGTAAHKFRDQVPARVKRQRFDAVMKLQQEISKEVNAGYMGKELKVLVDEVIENKGPQHEYLCRTEHDAPEVDGNCFVRGGRRHKPGDFVKVKIVDTFEYDLVGEEARDESS
ncbi:MAG: 30S ribosomal protein S12 methylthiotransferase RimO [Candidatus Omnitrophica bacterium]|nr:30S ribosomal protein S12 methylthiotransferase RimO [Candidatus Omnitrophota bacterium]